MFVLSFEQVLCNQLNIFVGKVIYFPLKKSNNEKIHITSLMCDGIIVTAIAVERKFDIIFFDFFVTYPFCLKTNSTQI